MKPQRIQLSRNRGFNLQAVSIALNGLPAVNCARPGKWGNLFVVTKERTAIKAVAMHKARIEANIWPWQNKTQIRQELRGKNLACYCALTDPCHCDTYLEIANA